MCTSLSGQRDTVRRIADLGYETLAFGHGPALTSGARARVARLTS
jgi:hypothetical protein